MITSNLRKRFNITMIDQRTDSTESKPPFVLLLGPSGVGKSAIIYEIERTDSRYKSVTPYTDRPGRPGEKKISIEPQHFRELQQSGYFASVNKVYGYNYGVPEASVRDLIKGGQIPILDFPLNRVADMERFKAELARIYILPPSLETLQQRLSVDGRAINNSRYEEGIAELARLASVRFQHSHIDAIVINSELGSTAKQIISFVDSKNRARL